MLVNVVLYVLGVPYNNKQDLDHVNVYRKRSDFIAAYVLFVDLSGLTFRDT